MQNVAFSGTVTSTELCQRRRLCLEFLAAAHTKAIAVTHTARAARAAVFAVFFFDWIGAATPVTALSAEIGIVSVFG